MVVADKLLLLSSACHGVEGHCGSGVQIFALHDAEWRAKARAQGVAVLYVHALNPHGFSHGRRVTHENVDINRNFLDFSKPLWSEEERQEWIRKKQEDQKQRGSSRSRRRSA